MKQKTSSKALSRIRAESAVASKRHAARANELLELIARRMARIVEDFYDIGTALKELKEKKLFAPLGFRTFDELLAKRVTMGRSQAYKLIAIVSRVTRAQAVGLGEEKAYAIARLVAETPEADSVESVLADGVAVGKKKAQVRTMSRREIDAARRAVVSRKKEADPAERTARAHAREGRAALRQLGISGKVEIAKAGGRWWASVRIRVEDLSKLLVER